MSILYGLGLRLPIAGSPIIRSLELICLICAHELRGVLNAIRSSLTRSWVLHNDLHPHWKHLWRLRVLWILCRRMREEGQRWWGQNRTRT